MPGTSGPSATCVPSVSPWEMTAPADSTCQVNVAPGSPPVHPNTGRVPRTGPAGRRVMTGAPGPTWNATWRVVVFPAVSRARTVSAPAPGVVVGSGAPSATVPVQLVAPEQAKSTVTACPCRYTASAVGERTVTPGGVTSTTTRRAAVSAGSFWTARSV